MTKGSRILGIVVLIGAMVLASGCGGLFKGGENKAPASKVSQSKLGIAPGEDSKIEKLIADYYKKLYSDSIENYAMSIGSGSIPANIKEFISKRTLDEGDNNPENGIHLPRYVEINGLTAIGYELMPGKDKNTPDIETAFLGNKDTTYLYYAKVNLKAKCLPGSVFDACFKQNPATKVYEKTGMVDENQTDYIKVQAKFDVEVVKEGEGYKILRASEASIKPGYQNRLAELNNEFLVRLPYLNTEKTADGKSYINKADGEAYEKEKGVIVSFFNNLLKLDKERMNLMSSEWNKGFPSFRTFMEKTGVMKDKDSKEIMAIGDDYRNKFDCDSFPVQVNMERIKKYSNFKVILHPGYSEKQKRYIVTFQASVEKINGIIGNETLYNYDYFVSLTGDGKDVKVNGIRLNEYYAPETKK